MYKIDSILVPIDFSSSSNPTLEYANMLADRFGAWLHLIHVIDDPFLYANTTAQAYREPFEKEAQGKLDAAADQLSGTPVTTALVSGKPYVEIVKYAAEHDIDLVVIGTHGHGAVTYVMLGSVAQNVIRTAKCPVLTVRHPEHDTTP